MLWSWPFVAFLLTLPLLLVQYIKYHRLPVRRVFLNYLFMLYAIGLFFAFTLFPLPDFAEFCKNQTHHFVEYIPFHSISDIVKDGKSAIFQVLMNVAFFLPYGVFLRNLYGKKLKSAFVIFICSSLLIETMQLTHIFGLLPCQYRIFDVDDVLANVSGGLIGFAFGKFLPDFSRTSKLYEDELNTKPGPVERLVIMLSEFLLIGFLSLFVSTLISKLLVFLTPEIVFHLNLIISLILFAGVEFVLPWFNKGRTLIGIFTHSSIDNKKRSNWRKLTYYVVRVLILGLMFSGISPQWTMLLCVIIVLTYPIKKVPIYAWI